MKLLIISLSLLVIISCSEDNPAEVEIPKREKLEFKVELNFLVKNFYSSTKNIFYMLNSKDDIDSIKYLIPDSKEHLKLYFDDFNFNDSTLIGITLVQNYSSSTKVFIDSLILQSDTIKVYWDMEHNNSVYQDITSPSDIVSIEKSDFPIKIIGDEMFE